jgi:hypothetical protein
MSADEKIGFMFLMHAAIFVLSFNEESSSFAWPCMMMLMRENLIEPTGARDDRRRRISFNHCFTPGRSVFVSQSLQISSL